MTVLREFRRIDVMDRVDPAVLADAQARLRAVADALDPAVIDDGPAVREELARAVYGACRRALLVLL